jgi:hypothetical protein
LLGKLKDGLAPEQRLSRPTYEARSKQGHQVVFHLLEASEAIPLKPGPPLGIEAGGSGGPVQEGMDGSIDIEHGSVSSTPLVVE